MSLDDMDRHIERDGEGGRGPDHTIVLLAAVARADGNLSAAARALGATR